MHDQRSSLWHKVIGTLPGAGCGIPRQSLGPSVQIARAHKNSEVCMTSVLGVRDVSPT